MGNHWLFPSIFHQWKFSFFSLPTKTNFSNQRFVDIPSMGNHWLFPSIFHQWKFSFFSLPTKTNFSNQRFVDIPSMGNHWLFPSIRSSNFVSTGYILFLIKSLFESFFAGNMRGLVTCKGWFYYIFHIRSTNRSYYCTVSFQAQDWHEIICSRKRAIWKQLCAFKPSLKTTHSNNDFSRDLFCFLVD